MTTTSDSQNLELSVTDFGPIAKAKIDLRPLTVFVGPSNTGKSYVAVLIYALHQLFSTYSRNANFSIPSAQLLAGWIQPRSTLSKNDILALHNWSKKKLLDFETDASIELPESVAALVRKALNNVASLNKVLDNEITRCFGIDKTKNLIRYSSDGKAEFSLYGNSSQEASDNLAFGYNVTVTKRRTKIDAAIPNTMPLQIVRKSIIAPAANWLISPEARRTGTEEQVVEGAMTALLRILASSVVPNIVGPFSCPVYYLPADRAGVMHAHQVAVRGLIASASHAGLRRDSPMPLLSGVLSDFMEQLVALASPTRREPEGDNDLALRMEQALLRGTVRVERSQIDYPSFVYRPEGWEKDLPLMNASSMVSELAPVVLYLRHVVRPGDLLIIEEPESHLHPAMQVEFVRQLAVAVKSGIRILLTTHSEWVLEELANLVRLSELPNERREGIDDPDVALRPDEVGAWFFESSSDQSGSVVQEMPLDLESGTFSSGFGLITEDLYNRWAEISNRIEEE